FIMFGKVFNFFKYHGFPIGKKRYISIPSSILSNTKYSIACVRGIFNTDGSIYSRYSKKYDNHAKHYILMNIEIKMTNKYIIYQIKSILDSLMIKTNNIRKNKESYVLKITHQFHIKKFMDIIQPSNKYHVERYLNRCR
ncbi:LAGLIDADG family homing endonuclease, partial [Nanoarchaeota archaeon]